MREIKVALVGDYSSSVVAHQAIPLALDLAAGKLSRSVEWEWLTTSSLEKDASVLSRFAAIWCVPGSPYASESGAIAAIRHARESNTPFLGTCGGCQHAILEYARNVLGLRDAEHAEANPTARLPLIAPLSCSLVEASGAVHLEPSSRLRGIYGRTTIEEEYHCRYGLNPMLEHLLNGSELKVAGRDAAGEVRAMELGARTFYILTQFQPERAALEGAVPPVVEAFLAASPG